MRAHKQMTGIYSIMHFLVDFSCAFLIYQKLYGTGELSGLLLIYNFCAFALQMPAGILIDYFYAVFSPASFGTGKVQGRKSAGTWAAAGCLAAAAAFLPGSFSAPGWEYAAVILAGAGNCLFHVGAGREVMEYSTKEAAMLGIFVSPGALGLYLGMILGKGGGVPGFSIPVLLVLGCVLMIWSKSIIDKRQDRSQLSETGSTHAGPGTAGTLYFPAAIAAAVVLRSLIGMKLDFSWKAIVPFGILLVLATAAGKACGGFVMDRIGAGKTAVFSLGISALCFLASFYPVFGVLAVFFFQMTMPVTLWAAGNLFGNHKGFAFGMLTFCLFLGFLPVYLGWGGKMTGPGYFLGCLISQVLILGGLKGIRR